MRSSKLTPLLLGAVMVSGVQVTIAAAPAMACGTPDDPCGPISVTPGTGSVFLGATSPGTPAGQGSGGTGGSSGSGTGSSTGAGLWSGSGAAGTIPAGYTPTPSDIGQALQWAGLCAGAGGNAANQGGGLNAGATPCGSPAPAAPAQPGQPAPAAPPPPTPAQLAVAAYALLKMPSPVPSHYPDGILKENGHPYTIVNTNTWFWTDPATWQPVSKSVSAGAVSATATATPVTLSFAPGDGGKTVTCTGPGTAFKATTETWIAPVNPQGCAYRYPKSSYGFGGDDQVTAVYTITWKVTWSGSDGSGGTFNNLQTYIPSRFSVAELQTVVTR